MSSPDPSSLHSNSDPLPLLNALWEVLVEESEHLEGSSAEKLQKIVERKDALTAQLANHNALTRDAEGKLANALSPAAIELLERCNNRNAENGQRILQRRQYIQERLSRLNQQGTYGASGTINNPQAGNWSAQA